MKLNFNTLKNLPMSPIVPTFEEITKGKNIIIILIDGTVYDIENKYGIEETYLEHYDSIFEFMKDRVMGITKENYIKEFHQCFPKKATFINYVKSRMPIVKSIYLCDM